MRPRRTGPPSTPPPRLRAASVVASPSAPFVANLPVTPHCGASVRSQNNKKTKRNKFPKKKRRQQLSRKEAEDCRSQMAARGAGMFQALAALGSGASSSDEDALFDCVVCLRDVRTLSGAENGWKEDRRVERGEGSRIMGGCTSSETCTRALLNARAHTHAHAHTHTHARAQLPPYLEHMLNARHPPRNTKGPSGSARRAMSSARDAVARLAARIRRAPPASPLLVISAIASSKSSETCKCARQA